MTIRVLRSLTWAIALLAAASGLAFVVWSLATRPPSLVEAELVFEALRPARGLPLYVDPLRGAWEDGAPASRFYVLYTPVWPLVIGKLAGPSLCAVRDLGRTVSFGAWLVVCAAPLRAATREGRARAAVAALLAAGLFLLTRNAPVGTPDTLAAALSCVGLARAVRAGRVDALSAVLLVAAPFVKPSCLGIVTGVALAHLAARVRPDGRALGRAALAGGVTLVALLVACHLASGGEWLQHLARSTGQPVSFVRWAEQQGTRAPLLGLPHLVVAVVAWRQRTTPLALLPLVTSLAWSSFSMAKSGSGTHYWFEPTAAAAVTLGVMPALGPRAAKAWTAVGGAFAAFAGATSLASAAAEVASYGRFGARIEALERRCTRGKDDVVVSTDVTVELAMNGRLLVPEWQTSYLVHDGRFPARVWEADLRHPHVRWLVLREDVRAPSARRDDAYVSVFSRELRATVEEEFELDGVVDGLFVYRRRNGGILAADEESEGQRSVPATSVSSASTSPIDPGSSCWSR